MRTKEEINKKIKELCSDSENFTSNNYGSLACDMGFYETHFSEYATEETLRRFVIWLLEVEDNFLF